MTAQIGPMRADIITREEYAKFVSTCAEATIFHDLRWLDAVCISYGSKLIPLGVHSKSRLVGVVPVLVSSLMFFKLYGSPLRKSGTPIALPALIPVQQGAEVLQALTDWIKRQRIGYFQMTWAVTETLKLPPRVWCETIGNLEIDLTPALQELWSGLAKLPRRKVRAAVRHGVRMHWMSDATYLDRHDALLQSTYKFQRIRPNYSSRLYREVHTALSDTNLKILAATYKGRIIAAVWVLYDCNRCYYWDAASLREFRELSAGHLLVWEIIRWAKRKRIRVFDMVGSGVGRGGVRPGIGRFKQSFGARPVAYTIVYRLSPWFRAALRLYRLYHGIRGKILSAIAALRMVRAWGSNPVSD